MMYDITMVTETKGKIGYSRAYNVQAQNNNYFQVYHSTMWNESNGVTLTLNTATASMISPFRSVTICLGSLNCNYKSYTFSLFRTKRI